MLEKITVWLINSKTFHHRIMSRFLRKRGWVVFYLEEENRICNGTCWLNLYQDGRKRELIIDDKI